MLHQSVDQFRPRVDDSLQFVVTSFRVRPEDVTSLEVAHFNQEVRAALAPKLWFTSRNKKPLSIEEGLTFLGTKRMPADKCFAPELPNQLASFGFVPQRVRIYVHDYRYDRPALRANIYWNRRNWDDDHPQTDVSIDENRRLYERLQCFAWNITGVWFARQVEKTRILLDFYNKDPHTPPSKRSRLRVDEAGMVRINY